MTKAKRMKPVGDRVESAAMHLADMYAYSAIEAICEGGCFNGYHHDVQRIAAICRKATQRCLRKYEAERATITEVTP